MRVIGAKKYRKWKLHILLLTTVCTGLILRCFKPLKDESLPPDIGIIIVTPDHKESDQRIFTLGDSISICIQVVVEEPIDSIVFSAIRNPDSTIPISDIITVGDITLFRGDISLENYITLDLEKPGNYLLAGYARSKDTIDIDTIYIMVADTGENEAPVIQLTPIHNYAAPSLPCSLIVTFSNKEKWQTVTLLHDSLASDIICKGDSLCIWEPDSDDISTMHEIKITAIDDGTPPQTVTATVTITVIEDSLEPQPPENLRVVDRTDNLVQLVWDGDSLSDGYTILRSLTGVADSWETITTTAETMYVDTTDTVFFYRVSAINYFGVSDMGPMIFACDTLHFAHTIQFRDSLSSISENDSIHTIILEVSQEARESIFVRLSVKGENDDFSSIELNSAKVTIAESSSTADVQINVNDDKLAESPETLLVKIDSVSSGFAAGNVTHSVVVTDNDTYYSLAYDKNGADKGDIPTDLKKYEPGTQVTVADNSKNLQKTNYIFDGWNTKNDGIDGIAYAPGDTLTIGTEDILLYAQWRVASVSTDDLLSSLKISAGTLQSQQAPVPDTLRDTVSYLDSVVTITPEVINTEIIIIIDTVSVKSGDASEPISLAVGLTEVLIKVVSPSGATIKNHILYIIRKTDSSVPLTKPPTGVSANGISTSEIRISWDDDPNATFYTIQSSNDLAGIFSKKGESSSNFFIDTDLDSGTIWYYRISASNSSGATDFSIAVSATTFLKPSFATQPRSQTVIEGNRAIFSISADGIPTPVFQWQKNRSDIDDATSQTCTTAVLTHNDNDSRFQCIISNAAGIDTSEEVVLTVDSLFTTPFIASQPGNTSIIAGEDTVLFITDTGSYLKVQWRKNGVDLPEATSCTLSLSDVNITDAGIYSVKIWNRIDSVNSQPFRLRILPQTPAELTALARSSQSIGISWSETEGALWYRVLRASDSDDFAEICSTTQTSMIDTPLTEGESYSYRIIAENNDGESAMDEPVSDTTWYGPRITQQPVSQSIYIGQTIDLTVEVTSKPPCSFQWNKGGSPLSGATTAHFTLGNALPSNSGDYNVTVSNSVRAENSSIARVLVAPACTLTTIAVPESGGTVSRSKIADDYPQGDSIRLTAHTNEGYRFNGWTGDTTVSDPNDTSILVVLNNSMSINAIFVRQYRLSVAIGHGNGSTSIQGDSLCDSGATIHLIATPGAGYRFDGWTGDSTASTVLIRLEMNESRSFIANFMRQYTLTLTSSAHGTVNPNGAIVVDSGVTTPIVATANAGCVFTAWRVVSGDATVNDSSATTTTVQLDEGDASVTGFFRILTFVRTFGGTASDEGKSVQQTNDGGYIVVGYTDSYGAGNNDVYLIKTNSTGTVEWTNTFGGAENDIGVSLQQTSDGGFIIAGYTRSFGAGSYDVYLIKTDAGGDLTWAKTYGTPDVDYSQSVRETTDGGFIVTGYTNSSGTYDVYLIKTESNGDTGTTGWTRTYGGTGNDYGRSVYQTNDRGFIITGNTNSIGNGSYDVYLIKTDAAGTQTWAHSFGGAGSDIGFSVQQTSDDGFIITGNTNSDGAGSSDVYLIKTDPDGNTAWPPRTFGGVNSDIGYSVQPTDDGGYIITGSTNSTGAGNNDVYLIKTDGNGNQSWTRTYGGGNNDIGLSVQQTIDDGYVITGYTFSTGAGSDDIYLIKTDENGDTE